MHVQQSTRVRPQHHAGSQMLILGLLIAALSAAPQACRPSASRTGRPTEQPVLLAKDI
ncbi:hypothetical protein [Thermithiobacillus plumbiphilus]|uniref:Uncharacterized protein n=1 Tax=Thermithiobacillus plumbiphilus TaxID=1729899 RepID=A0ABU9D959_9PROT